MFTNIRATMSYLCTESHQQDGMVDEVVVRTTLSRCSPRLSSVAIMLPFVIMLCICSLPNVHSMSITHSTSDKSLDSDYPFALNGTVKSIPKTLEENLRQSEEFIRTSDVTLMDIPSLISDAQESLDFNAVLKKSYAEARAGCSNMSSADVLKSHVEKLRNTDNGQVDLVFLVDSSASVGITDFFNELKFVRKLLAGFEVAEWATQVAVITFASRHRVVVNIDHLSEPSPNKHKCSLLNAELPGITYVGGGTYTRGAFVLAEKVLSSQFTRPNATKAVFLITDGYSNGGDPRPIAQTLVRNNVEIFTFGIRNGNVKELHAMASEPKRQHCYILDSFQEFEALARRALHEDLHLGDFILENVGLCSSLCPQGGHCCHPAATCRCGTTTGQYECICPQGYYGSGFVAGCHACPAGTYKPQPTPGGIGTCKVCPDPNHTSQLGSTNVADCTCRSGYQTVNGEPACQMIKCPLFSPPTNGFFVSGECSNTVHSACALRCSPGYELSGRPIRACSEDGSWSGEPAVCRVKKCHPLQQIPSGMIHCTKEDFAFDTECTTLCNRGYILVGSKMRRCLPIALWDGLPSACRAVTCLPLEAIPHGTLQPATCSSDRQTYGTECSIVCDLGYQRKDEGEIPRRCLASGLWSPKPDQLNVCIDATMPDILCSKDITVDAIPNDSIANVSWAAPLTVDNSGDVPVVTVSPAVRSPWLFPIGAHSITYFATDKSGNSASCSFVVTVVDSQPPVIEQCHSPGAVLATDNHNQQVAWDEPQFSDNSGRPVTVSRSHDPGLSMSWGTTNVEYIARDETGNTKSCHITVNVQQSACVMPQDPQHGRADCLPSNGGIECSLRCNEGYAFPIEPEPVYSCSESGHWTPSHAIPWEDCSKKENPTNATLPVKFMFPVDFCDQHLADEMADNIRRSQENKVENICSGPVDCRFAGIRVNCVPKDSGSLTSPTVDVSSSSRGQRQQLRGDISFDHEQLERLQTFPGVFVDMNITGTLNLLEGVTSVDEDSYQELRSALSSVPNSIAQSVLEEENIPPGMGAQMDANSLIMLPSESIPICRPGNVLEFTQCLQCAIGTFFNEETSECERCPQGSYQDQPGQLQCRTCPPGTSTATTRAQSLQECKDICSPGSHSATGFEQCETCAKGSYQMHSGSTECVPCPAGTSTPKTGATTVTECLEPCKPRFVSKSGLVPCLPCPDGYYQPGISKISCYKCPQTALTNNAVATWEDCVGTDLEGFNISTLEVLLFNDCFSIPCAHGGTCQPVSAGYVCICQPGYTGITCDTDMNDCDSSPCKNGASCQDRLNDFVCVCPPGFEGKMCTVDIDECQHHICQHDGTCIDGIASYECVCPMGYAGHHCEREVNECISGPCYHGARCVDGLARFSCDCPPGYYGTFCEMEHNECLSNPCWNGATCHDLTADYRCDCASGFTGAHCEVDSDECSSSPCQHVGLCIDGVDSYRCVCQHGFTGQMCEVELPWDFNLRFDHLSTTDYILMGDALPDLKEVTAGFWIQTSDSFNYGCPFSYGAMTSEGTALSNAFTFMDYSGFVLYINDSSHVSDVTANDGLWHHIAVTWTNRNGEWIIYKDGQVADSGEGLAEGAVIPGGGVFVVGQEQDSIGGDFASSEAFLGEITLLHIWDRALTGTEILGLLQDCQKPMMEDLVLAWPDLLFGMYGEIQQLKNYFCQGCYAPLQPDYGDYTGYQTATPLNVVYYSCEPGFEFDSSTYTQATCQISGDWLPYDPPMCQRKRCWFPGDIQNGEIIGNSFSYESEIEYICHDGYTLIGPADRECLETGVWSGYQPRCEVVVCGEVPQIPNSNVDSPVPDPYSSADTTLIYHCKEGYRLQGPAVITCGSDGHWSQLPECLAIVCNKPDRNPHSSFTSSEGYVLGARVTYNCYAGYQLVGNTTRTCQPDALWSGSSPMCVPLQCGPPPNITFATYSATGLTFQSVAQYSCLDGYQIHGNGSLMCTFDLKWAGEFLECLPTLCPDIPPIAHGAIIGDLFHYGESVTFMCDVGYQLEGSTSLVCLARGVWNSSVPACKPLSCGPPDETDNGQYEGENFEFMDVVSYLCNIGFNLIGQATRSCGADGQWNGTLPHCEKVTCEPLPVISNADVVSLTEHEMYPYQTNVTFQCHTGYTLQEGVGTLTCGLDSTWQGETSMCEAVICERLGGLLNGRLIRTGHNYNDTATYLCQEGFNLIGVSIRVCQANGRWSGVPSRCFPISCPLLPTLLNAKFTVKAPNETTQAETYSYRTKIRYRCDSGYQLDGNQELRCTVAGEWSAAPPSCQPIRCHDLPSLSHGRIHGEDLTYNKSVSYTCNTGYRLIGEPIRTCLADGTWNGDFPVCEVVVCGEPGRPENSRVAGYNFLYQDVVTYSCDQGYILSGAFNITCLATGQWSASPPQCEPINCGPPPTIINTTHTTNSTLYGSLATYTCQEGYRPDGDLTVQCRWDGVWVGGALVRCSPMLCGGPPSVEFGFVKDVDYYVGDTAEYTCIEGAVLHSDGHMTCLPNRTWTPSTTYCRLITCPEILAPSRGTVHSPQRNNGSVAVFTCDDGYIISGVANATCMANGTWSHEIPKCERVSCPMPYIQNGTALFSDHRFSDMVSYRCDVGYQLVGDVEQYCLANATWGDQTTVCRVISCGVPNPIDNGIVMQNEVFYEGKVTYSCDAGYRLQGQATRSCTSSGVLSGEKPTCEIISCPKVPMIKHAVSSGTNSTYGSLVSYHCIDGYYTVDHTIFECLSNGSWNQTIIECLPVSCGYPDGIENANYSLNDGSTFGSVVLYRCHEGYAMQGNASVVCQSNAEWGKTKPSCEPVSCGPPPQIENGDVISTAYTYLSSAMYTCQIGYVLVGSDVKDCLSNGSWSYTDIRCEPVSCDQPEPINNGRWSAQSFVLGNRLLYTCDLGHELVGSTSVRMCMATGHWSDEPPICQPIKCSSLPKVKNGMVLTQGNLQYQSEVRYRCDTGYVPSSSELTRVCQADGTWSGWDLTCFPISCGLAPAVDNTRRPLSPTLTFNTTTVYHCHSGYQLQGLPFVTCLANGSWSAPRFQCSPISCGDPEHILNGRVHTSRTTFNSLAVYTCNEGFRLYGTGTHRCLANRSWSATLPVCKPVPCGLPPSILYAVHITNDISLTIDDYVFGAVAHYACVEGYKMQSSNTLVCQSNGTWNTTNLCQIRHCPPPSAIDNGYAVGESHAFRSTIQYVCDPGFEIIGSPHCTCLAIETWHPSPPKCTRISCPEVITPPLTTVSGGGHLYQDTLTFHCMNDLQLQGAKELRCKSDGTWDQPIPSCAPKTCGRPSSLDNGEVFGHSYQPGDTISYNCFSGYILDGPSGRKCLPDYRWNGRDPKCVTLALNQSALCIFPCLHGGTCVAPYQCSCPYGFAGSRCEKELCMSRCIGSARCSERHPACK